MFFLHHGINGFEVFLGCFLAWFEGLMSAAALVPLRFFIDEEGLSRGLTLELRDEDLEDSGLVFIICLLLLFLGDGFNNLA